MCHHIGWLEKVSAMIHTKDFIPHNSTQYNTAQYNCALHVQCTCILPFDLQCTRRTTGSIAQSNRVWRTWSRTWSRSLIRVPFSVGAPTRALRYVYRTGDLHFLHIWWRMAYAVEATCIFSWISWEDIISKCRWINLTRTFTQMYVTSFRCSQNNLDIQTASSVLYRSLITYFDATEKNDFKVW